MKNDMKNGYETPWNTKVIKMRTNASFIYYSGAWKGLSEIVVVNLSRQKRLSSFCFTLVSSPTIFEGTSYVNNALCRILAPRTGLKFVIEYVGSLPYGIWSCLILQRTHTHSFEERQHIAIPLSLQFQYKPS